MRNVGLNYEKMRQIVLSQSYSKVFIVEEDMVLPDDALEKILAVDAPIVTGLYALRHGTPTSNIFRYEERVRSLGNNMKWDEVKRNWGKTIRVTGGAMGCLLVDRSALLDFNFEIKEQGAPDIPFMVHCATNNIKTVARMDVVCGHINANGTTLYPDRDKGWVLV